MPPRKPIRKNSAPKKRGPAPQYPWKSWVVQEKKTETTIKLKQGKDYKAQPHSLVVQLREKAKLHGVRISIKIDGPIVWVTRLGKRAA